MVRFPSHAIAPMFSVFLFTVVGCSSSETPEGPASCPAGDEIAGACAGVPQSAVCSADGACTSGIACASVISVANDAGLAAATSSATAGACIALAPGSYGAVTLPGGVSLLGRSAAEVSIQGLVVGAGENGVIRGLTVQSGGVKVDGATSLRLESVLVIESAGVGVDVSSGSSVTIVASEITGSSYHGIKAVDGTDVRVDRSIIEGSQGPGILSVCSTECGCELEVKLAVTSSIVRDNHIGGISVFGATTTLSDVNILGTRMGDQWHYTEGGGGLSVAGCSVVNAVRTRVTGNDRYGVLVDQSDANLGGPTPEDGFDVSDNVMGIWVQNISKDVPQTVLLENARVDSNEGVGIGVSGETRGLIICRSAVSSTTTKTLPVKGELGASQEIGHGLAWTEDSEVTITELALSASASASLLIDGEAFGSIANVMQSGGDEQKGIVQQNFKGGAQPAVKENAPQLTTDAGKIFQIPLAPAVITSL